MSFTLRENLATNLKELRSVRQKSLTDFADDLGIGRSTLCGLETGKKNTTLETVDHMALRLAVPAASLLCCRERCEQCAVGVVWLNDRALAQFTPAERQELMNSLRIICNRLGPNA